MSANERKEDQPDKHDSKVHLEERIGSSMTSLILWNVTKALNIDPSLDLKSALSATQLRLESSAYDVNSTISQHPGDRNLICALLAWQQLGHSHTSSLYTFIESSWKRSFSIEQPESSKASDPNNQRREDTSSKMPLEPQIREYISYKESAYSNSLDSSSFALSRMGPVVKLPVEERVVMHLQNTSYNPSKSNKAPNNCAKPTSQDIMNKIDAACCVESACQEKLAQVEAGTREMRERAVRLAKREAERVELLERAEAAWREVEHGYQRRLRRAEDQGEDLLKQIQTLVGERQGYRSIVGSLAQKLKCRGGHAESERERLAALEQQVYEHACARHRLAEQAARADAVLADHQCKVAQLDRNLQFKEEQTRCKRLTQTSELEAARALTHEAERVMHAELTNLKEHLAQASADVLQKDADNKALMETIEELKQEKNELLEGLETCQDKCDGEIKDKIDLLKQKRQQFNELKEKILECRCKMPVEAAVGVRRTPSLAVLCCCEPEDRFCDSCSCTSLRGKLMNDLLADLFSGLQGELGNCAAEMPCQLLKCFEEKHSWDRTSPVKTNIEKFFAKLLISELDIAIATSIEKYHAKWVGTSCVDAARMPADPSDEDEGWQQRAIERRAQKLAAKLAEQLFQQRADQLTSKAKEIIKANPPCDCPGPSAVYQCLMKPNAAYSPFVTEKEVVPASTPATSSLWRRTQQTITHLKDQLDSLKTETLKKQDLRKMEQNIMKLLQRTKPENDVEEHAAMEQTCQKKPTRSDNLNQLSKNFVKPSLKKKLPDSTQKKINRNPTTTTDSQLNHSKVNKPASYAINLCLCSTQKTTSKPLQQSYNAEKKSNSNAMPLGSLKQFSSLQHDVTPMGTSKTSAVHTCPNNCKCFNKIPSGTSIDKLLETLTKWKNELTNSTENVENAPAQKELLRKTSVTFSDTPDVGIKKCLLKSCRINSKSSLINLNNNTKTESFIPIAKNSEFLATENLEKSNECCKCEETIEKLKSSSIHVIKNNSNSVTKSNGIQQTIRSQEKNYNEKCAQPEPKRKLSNTVGDGKSDEFFNSANMKQISKSSIPEVCDCDYNIYFLGASITNDQESLKSSKYNMVNNGNIDSNSCNCRNPYTQNSKEYTVSKHCTNDANKKNTQDEKSKVVITQSFNVQVSSEPTQNQISTNGETQNEEDYQNLEANTFDLLREHLEKKIMEYKKEFQYSSIPIEEERKLCSTILQKVKQVISESTNYRPYCTCPSDFTSADGTWNRAYSLLQEYLKTKLKRVQCICDPVNSEKHNENIMPVILENICGMIEKDFSKLSHICGSKNEIVKKERNQNSLEIPEKDTNSQVSSHKTNTPENTAALQPEIRKTISACCIFKPVQISRQISTNIIPLTENMYSQVPLKLGMESKYCSAGVCVTDMYSKNIQSELKQNNSCSCTCLSENEQFPEVSPLIINAPSNTTKDETNIKIFAKDFFDNLPKNDTTCRSPYVGYTVECSCVGKLDSCVCSKGLTSENDKIKKIWNDLGQLKTNVNDVSYILKKSINRVKSDSDIGSKQDNKMSSNTNDYCDTEILTSNEDEMLKKTCVTSSNQKYETANTLVKYVYSDIPQLNNINSPLHYKKVGFNENGELNCTRIKKCKSDLLPKCESHSSLDVENIFGKNCDCSMIPICHIKMLMESISNKLAHSKCTCDSLSSNVCPVHAKPDS